MCRASGVRTNGAVAPTVLCDHVAAARGSFGTLGRQRSVSQLAHLRLGRIGIDGTTVSPSESFVAFSVGLIVGTPSH